MIAPRPASWQAIRAIACSTLLAGLALDAQPALGHDDQQHHHAHVHGLARLAVVVQDRFLYITVESPLDNLVGFEHAPRTPDQQEAVARMVATLNAPADLFSPSAAARCSPVRVALESPVLAPAALEQEPPPPAEQLHADLIAEFDFECATPAELNGLAVELFTHFPRLERINAELVVPGGQSAARLDARSTELRWR